MAWRAGMAALGPRSRWLTSLRFPVQYVARQDGSASDDFRGYLGEIESGSIRKGQKIKVLPGDSEATVAEIYLGNRSSSKQTNGNNSVDSAQTGQAAGQRCRTRARKPARHLRTHAGARAAAFCGQTLGHPPHGAALRPAAQLHRGAGRRETPRRPQPGQPRRARGHAHALAGPARRGQDPLRPPDGRAGR